MRERDDGSLLALFPLAAQQEAFGGQDFWQARPIILPDDAAAIRARRILDKMIRAEQVDQQSKRNAPLAAAEV